MRYAIYLRQSKEREHSVSVEFQEDDCRTAVARLGGIVAGVWVDKLSGSNRASVQRPQYRAMLAAADAWDVLMVWRLDRAGRHELEFHRMLADLEERGKTFATATEDVSDPLGRSIRIAVAADAARKIGEAAQRGRRKRASQGYWPQHTPFGTRSVGGVLERDEATWWIVEETFRRMAAGEARNVVDRWLVGVTRGTGKAARIIQNPAYVGRVNWLGQDYPAQWGPLIDPALAERARAAFARRGRPQSQHRKDHVWLDGLTVCGGCGSRLSVRTTTQEKRMGRRIYFYLACTHYNGRGKQTGCGAFASYRVTLAQAATLDQLQAMVDPDDADTVRRAIEEVNQRRMIDGAGDRGPKLRERDELTARLKRAEDAYLSGALSPDRARAVRLECEQRIAELDVELSASVTVPLIDTDAAVRLLTSTDWLRLAETDAPAFHDALASLGCRITYPSDGGVRVSLFSG